MQVLGPPEVDADNLSSLVPVKMEEAGVVSGRLASEDPDTDTVSAWGDDGPAAGDMTAQET